MHNEPLDAEIVEPKSAVPLLLVLSLSVVMLLVIGTQNQSHRPKRTTG